MLSLYPSAATVKKAGVKQLQKIKGINEGKAASILKKADGNRQQTSDTISYTIASMAKEILGKEEQIKQHKRRLSKSFAGNEDVKLLESMPGIAIDSAVGLMIEIENINRFDTCKKLCAYFGVHPTFKQSGDGKWGSHMSKKGRPAVRKILYMSSLTAIRWNPSIKQLYARKRSDGFNHYEAMGVVMHKLLRIIYGLLKNKSAFNTATDDANKQKALKKEEEKKQGQKDEKKNKKSELFRFQGQSLDAPISRHAASNMRFAQLLKAQTNARNVRYFGTIVAFEYNRGKDEYLNNISQEITAYMLGRGIYLRPLGNTVYIMPPYCITELELEKVYEAISSFLDLVC